MMEAVNRVASGVDVFFEQVGSSSGLGGDQVKYLVCLLSAVPLGLVFAALPTKNKRVRQIFGMFWGLAFCFFCLGRFAWLHSFGTALVTYALLKFAPAKSAHNFVFVFLMGYMSAAHLYRTYTDYLGYHLDFTGPQMLLTQSLTSLAFQLHDGRRLKAGLKLEEPYLAEKALSELPSLFDYFSFVYFFPAFLAGPSHQFKDFMALCDGSLFPGGRTPPNVGAVAWGIVRALFFAPSFFLVAMVPVSFLLEAEYAALPYWRQWGFVMLALLIYRCRYYFAWYLSEVSFIASGAGYSSNGKWDRVRNVHPLKVEFAENIRGITSNWNICTANWLKYYVYWRLPSGPIATYGTYFVSAFWHGFYPGYYMFFIYAALLTETARVARRVLRPHFVITEGKTEKPRALKPVYDWVGVFLTMSFTNFGGVGFVLLSFEASWAGWRAQHFIGLIAVPLFFVYLSFIHPILFRAKREKTN